MNELEKLLVEVCRLDKIKISWHCWAGAGWVWQVEHDNQIGSWVHKIRIEDKSLIRAIKKLDKQIKKDGRTATEYFEIFLK